MSFFYEYSYNYFAGTKEDVDKYESKDNEVKDSDKFSTNSNSKLELPDLPHYHPNSPLCTREGYYPNLTQLHLQAVENLKDKLLKVGLIDIVNTNNNDEEHWFFKLLRFLRARKFNVDNAYELFMYDYKWRNSDEIRNLSLLSAQEVLNCDIYKMYEYFPTWLQGFDKQGQPVSYRKFGYFEIWNVLKLIEMDTLIKFHTWECEQAIRLMRENSKKLNKNIETFIIVVDAANWSLRLATSEAYTFIQNMIAADSKHNPERLGTMFIINAPSALSIAYSVIRPFMDEVTRNKAHIYSSREQWEPALQELIDKEQIPQQYGGLAPDFTPEESFASLNPPTTINTSNLTPFFVPIDNSNVESRSSNNFENSNIDTSENVIQKTNVADSDMLKSDLIAS